MKKILLYTLLSFIVITAKSQEKKGITHENLWLMKRVGAPAVSPDGQWVIFSVNEPNYDEKEQVNDIWIMPTDGSSKARRLTANKGGESAYVWSPDGKYIAFVSKREGDEESQIYLLNFKEGGEAQRFTNLSSGAAAPRWSPDGSSILFQSTVYPNCYTDSLNKVAIEEKKKIKYKARVYTSFPIRDFDKWRDEKQTHLFIQSLEPESKARNIFAEVKMSQNEGFRLSAAVWSPDGKEIVFAATEEAQTSAYKEPSYNIYKMSASGGNATKISDDKYSYGSPVFSPDGKYLLVNEHKKDLYKVYDLGVLTRLDWPSMQHKTPLAVDLDRPVHGYKIYKNDIYMVVEDQGRDKIYIQSLNGGAAKPFSTIQQGCFANISLSTGDKWVAACNYENAVTPSEITLLNADGSSKALTSFNTEAIAKLDLQPIETIWTTASTGKKVRSIIVKPAGFDPAKKYPLFVMMHGGPASSWKENWGLRWNYHLIAQPGYVLIMTDYTGSTGYGEKFGQDIQYDPFKGPAKEINEAAADAIKRFSYIDGSRQAAGGGSYGGHLANWMQATTTHYKCLVCHAGLVNSISQWATSDGIYHREMMNGGVPWADSKVWKEQNPFYYADKFKTPMLITIGELDYRVPINNSIENWHILQRLKIPSKLIVFPEENHWINKGENSRFFYQELHKWLETYLLR